MGAKARLETQITGDEAPFIQAVNRAEKRAESFSGKLQGLFRRTPHARAERALSGFLGGLATGDIQGAIVGVTERMRGLGLAAGIGIGAAIIVFQKAQEQIDAVNKSVQNLNANLARPLSLQSALGPEGIGKELENTEKTIQDVQEKRKGFFAKLLSYLQTAPEGSSFKRGGNQFQNQLGVPKTDQWTKAQESGETRLKALALARANAELGIARIKQTAEKSSEREAALLKTSMDYEKRIAEIQLESGLTKPGRSAEVLFRRLAAAKIEHEAAVDPLIKRFDLAKLQEETEQRILALHNSTLSKSNQQNVALKERINFLKQELALTNDPIKRAGIQNQIQGAQNQLSQGQYNESKKPWSQRAQEMQDQQDYQNYVRNQQPTSPNAYKSHPDAYNRRDILGNKIDPNGNVIGPGGSGPDKQGVGLLGKPGVLDAIERNTSGMGENK